MELLRGRHELRCVCHRRENDHGRVDDLRAQVLTDLVKVLHVVAQDLLVYRLQNVFLGSQAGNERHVACEPQVNDERTGLGVHAAEEDAAYEPEALLERLSVVDQLVVDDLAHEADRRLRQVLVFHGHV